MKELQLDRIDSPIGTILVVADGEQLCSLDFADYESRMLTLLQRRYGPFQLRRTTDPQGFSSRIRAYLAGEYRYLDAIPVSTGGTVFQQEVWSALRTIPAGTTMTYGQLAKKLGRPAAFRAVGSANALNPIPIVLPCHRVVGANAELTGYGGGIERKRWLLQHEGCDPKQRKNYTLINADGKRYTSTTPGTLGGHRRNRGYGRLDCPSALRWIAKGYYVKQRVFFADEATAIAAGYRPCATCMKERYTLWKRALALTRRREDALALYRTFLNC
jgi:methylated-DNA-[protein]-cysteine S-methyltransferase